ncbi:hypothetical protein MOQ72_29320 [Saccharopolyspora sp. K220]|uniref:hypothetical protein n=1 Tax=Saccharopolyspora soli TaxID=2926618 RepID=UPI001F57E7EA|nr:hypothetical protein [Saccharopolyspora soli]MCI2421543.1 hypothetical protein [Saccharopolyspora soli]
MRLGKRWRRQALPLAGIGATHAIGAAASSLSGPAALLPVAAGWAVAAGTYGYAHQRTSRWNRLYAGVAAVGSAGWQAALALDGPTGVTAGLLWACGAALSVPWWVRHTEPEPDITAERSRPIPQQAALPAAPSGPDPRVELWSKHVGANGKPLPGSKLTHISELPFGWRGVVELNIGDHWHSIMKVQNTILSVFDLPDGRVFVEAIPGASVRTAQITVLTSDPLQAVTRWERPQLDPSAGTFPLMVTADGELLHYRFWWPGGGATHGLVSGVNGSGKTKVLDLILTEASCSDRVYPLIVDGGGGASLPHWRNRVKLFAETPKDARKLLRYALRLMDRRRTVIKRQGGGSVEPTPDMPLILIVIDEAHKLLMNDEDDGTDNGDVRRMCEKLSQEGRKYGIALVLATQVPSAKQLGGSTVLRDQLKGGTVVGLRVTERTSGNMITSGAPMPEGLHQLPAVFPDGTATRGLGYMLTARMIRARSLLIEDPSAQPLTPTRLDPDCAAEPAPMMTGDATDLLDTTPAPNAEPRTAVSPDEIRQLVDHAIEAGTNPDPLSLMKATGLSLGKVRRALADRNNGGGAAC